MIGHAQRARSAPKSNASIAKCMWFSLAKKSRANRRTSRPRIVRAPFIFETVRLIVITRMCERTHLPGARQVTNCQKRVTLVRHSLPPQLTVRHASQGSPRHWQGRGEGEGCSKETGASAKLEPLTSVLSPWQGERRNNGRRSDNQRTLPIFVILISSFLPTSPRFSTARTAEDGW